MNFTIGCDHAGPVYKNTIIKHLKERGFSVKNRGTDGEESVDYPDFAHIVANDLENKTADLGVLICGSANGVAMTANKHELIRAGIAWTPEVASLARTHNNANVICIPARFVSEAEAVEIVDAFIDAEFEGGRHARRVGKIACTLLAALLSIGTSFTQDIKPTNQPLATQYAEMLDTNNLRSHLSVLSSDGFEGRETGTRGAALAAAYLESYYIKTGFKPYDGITYTQQVPMTSSQINGGMVNVGDNKYNIIEDFLLYPGIEKVTMKPTQMVFVGYGIVNDEINEYLNIDVKGKVVVVLTGDPRNNESAWAKNISKKRELPDSLGAKAFVVLMNDSEYSTYKGRMKFHMMRKSTVIKRKKTGEGSVIPTFFFSDTSGNNWVSSVKGIKSVSKTRAKAEKKGVCPTGDIEALWSYKIKKFSNDFFGLNVLAYLPGSDPVLKDEVVVITSHYDHIGIINGEINNGADDDGSGTVAVMELARLYMEAANNNDGPKRSVLFMNVIGEEMGLLGSEWYSDHPIFPLKHTVANLNLDMIGRVDEAHQDSEKYVYLIGADKLSSELHDISETANATYTNLKLDYTYNEPDDPNRFYYRSDHYNFAKHNIPVIFYFSGVHEDYHKPGDDVDKIMFSKTGEIGKLVFYTAWELLNRQNRITVDKVNDFPE